MSSRQKSLTIVLWCLVAVAIIGVAIGRLIAPHWSVAARGPGGDLLAISSGDPHRGVDCDLFTPPDIRLIDQDGRAFSTSQLRGHPWVADFIFTTCGSICPTMSHEMAALQAMTPAEVNFVSFTVDPAHDSPAVLKAYGQSLHADFSRWHFLTGTAKEMVDAAYAMEISVKPAQGDAPLTHSDRFLLISAGGAVVGIYDGSSHDDVRRLAADAARLAAGTDRETPS